MSRRPATPNMINYAETIAETLGIKEPDYTNFIETQEFIGDNQAQFNKVNRDKWDKENQNYIPNWVTYDRGVPHSKESIIHLAKLSGKRRSGVYFLWNENEVVYVGQSVDLYNRVYSSVNERRKETDITHISVLVTDNETDAYILETVYITDLKPKLNRALKEHEKSNTFTVKNLKLPLEELDKVSLFDKEMPEKYKKIMGKPIKSIEDLNEEDLIWLKGKCSNACNSIIREKQIKTVREAATTCTIKHVNYIYESLKSRMRYKEVPILEVDFEITKDIEIMVDERMVTQFMKNKEKGYIRW